MNSPNPLEVIFWLMDEVLKGITLRPLTPYVWYPTRIKVTESNTPSCNSFTDINDDLDI